MAQLGMEVRGHHIGLRDRTRLPSLAKGLYWMSHLTGPAADS